MSNEMVEESIGYNDENYNKLQERDLNVYYADDLIAIVLDTQQLDPTFHPIWQKKLLTAKLLDSFCSDVSSYFNTEGVPGFDLEENF